MLVVLRLVIGWHFYKEGAKKLADPDQFSSAPFLLQAKGPLAPLYHGQVPDFHGWQTLLAQPLPDIQLSGEQQAEVDRWKTDYTAQVKQAESEKKPIPIEFPPHSPYKNWAQRIVDDWGQVVREFVKDLSLEGAQREAAAELLDARLIQLRDYFHGVPKKLEGQSEEIAKYRHELWRLEQLRADVTAGEVPFQDSRIAEKTAETQRLGRRWLNDVKDLERGFYLGLVELLDKEQKQQALDTLFRDPLKPLDTAVTYLILGVGVLLVLGLFTRTAALFGAAFLLSVIVSQPPWVDGAMPVYEQSVEMIAMLVLVATGPGRWAGLDFFVSDLFCKCCRTKKA